MRVTMRTDVPRASGTLYQGHTVELPRAQAEQLVRAGAADPVDRPKASKQPPRDRAGKPKRDRSGQPQGDGGNGGDGAGDSGDGEGDGKDEGAGG